MCKKYLVLDCNYLCHRAKYSTGGLSFGGTATGVVYGFLRSLSAFQDLFNTSNFVFCWDSNTSKRKEIYPEYKANREKKEYTDEEIEFDKAFRIQMKKLRTTYLSTIGFKNVFVQRGYEADDIIAEISLHSIRGKEEAVIISSDKDLYQCIEANVSFYNPQTNKILTLQGFKKQYGIEPMLWGMVKSLAGCTTDNVRGIKGIGEKRAIDFLLNRLNSDSKAYQAITSLRGNEISDFNQRLVVLPMHAIYGITLKEDELSEQGWKQVSEMLGMKTLRNKMPFGRKRK